MLTINFLISIRKKIINFVLTAMVFIFSHNAFSQRAFSIRTPAFNIQGDAVIIGNRSLVGSQASKDDDKCNMNNLDLDGDPTTIRNSTSADLNLPAGSSVVWAGLYWAGRSLAASRNTMKLKKSEIYIRFLLLLN